jgi:hypothetical protein
MGGDQLDTRPPARFPLTTAADERRRPAHSEGGSPRAPRRAAEFDHKSAQSVPGLVVAPPLMAPPPLDEDDWVASSLKRRQPRPEGDF